MKHLGVELIKRKCSYNLIKEEFALINKKPSLPRFDNLVALNAYLGDDAKEYTIAWCESYRELCLENFDLNMKYFNLLDYQEFCKAVFKFLNRHHSFLPVEDLHCYDGAPGYYMMVLDEYKQVYIGKSEDIGRRIRQHWTKTKAFDRTLLPMYAVSSSCFSIDFFRALDTTRIYVWKRSIRDGIEKKLIEEFPERFCTNRIGGDVTNAIEALGTLHTRSL